MNWHSVHVHYYAPDKDALLLHGVRPALRQLAGRVDAAYFMRHWRQGPHVRLNVRTGPDTFHRVVVPLVTDVVGGFLAEHPSTHVPDRDRELAAHRRLADLEQEAGPLTPWFPDNRIRVAPYDSRERVLGSRAAAELYAGFHAATTDLTFGVIEQRRGPARLATAFDMLVATAHAASTMDITRAFISFRSHAESFLCGFPEGAGARPAWDRHYARNAGSLVKRLTAVVAALDAGRADVPFVHDWVTALGRFRRAAVPVVEGGLIALPARADPTVFDDPAGYSPFHRRLFANPRWEQTLASPDFTLYRLLLNVTYLTLTRLGVTPAERFLLCHLVANAVEDRYRVSALELVGRA